MRTVRAQKLISVTVIHNRSDMKVVTVQSVGLALTVGNKFVANWQISTLVTKCDLLSYRADHPCIDFWAFYDKDLKSIR